MVVVEGRPVSVLRMIEENSDNSSRYMFVVVVWGVLECLHSSSRKTPRHTESTSDQTAWVRCAAPADKVARVNCIRAVPPPHKVH